MAPRFQPQPTNGSTMRTPLFRKSERFRVATARPWTAAVAAMRLSLIGMVFPVVRRRASNSAHFRPVAASQARQWSRPTPVSNQRSRALRFLPLGRMRILNRSSPRTTGQPQYPTRVRGATRIGRWFGRLAQNIRADQALHSVSVDSDSIGTKKSFCGQASSQSMAPSFGRGARRTRR